VEVVPVEVLSFGSIIPEDVDPEEEGRVIPVEESGGEGGSVVPEEIIPVPIEGEEEIFGA
jgi:hypothetical protein